MLKSSLIFLKLFSVFAITFTLCLLVEVRALAEVGPVPSHNFGMSCTKVHYDNIDSTVACFGVTLNKKLFIAPFTYDGYKLNSPVEVPGSDASSAPTCFNVSDAPPYNYLSQVLCFYRSSDSQIKVSHFLDPRVIGREKRHKVFNLGGSLKSAPSCLTVSNSPQSRYVCFAILQDDALWMLNVIFDGSANAQKVASATWKRIGGSLNSQPSCVLDGDWATKKVKCLYAEKGTNSFHSLEGDVDGGWSDIKLTGIIAQAPICSVTPLNSFAISCYTKNLLGKIIFRYFSNNVWSPWKVTDVSIKGTISGCIKPTATGGSLIGNECFATSASTGEIFSFIYNNANSNLYIQSTGVYSVKAPSCFNVQGAPGMAACLYRDQSTALLRSFVRLTKTDFKNEYGLKVY